MPESSSQSGEKQKLIDQMRDVDEWIVDFEDFDRIERESDLSYGQRDIFKKTEKATGKLVLKRSANRNKWIGEGTEHYSRNYYSWRRMINNSTEKLDTITMTEEGQGPTRVTGSFQIDDSGSEPLYTLSIIHGDIKVNYTKETVYSSGYSTRESEVLDVSMDDFSTRDFTLGKPLPKEIPFEDRYDWESNERQYNVKWRLTPITEEITVEGQLGDIVEVDLSQLELTNLAFAPGQSRQGNQYPGNHGFPANDRGYVAQIDNWEQVLSNEKRFWFVPFGVGESKLRLTGQQDGEEKEKAVKLVIGEGYGSEPVTFNSNRLDIYRQQQRLKHFGFRNKEADPLQVTGSNDASTNWARGLFVHAVKKSGEFRGRLADIGTHRPEERFTPRGEAFINAANNAPRWVEFTAGAGYVINPAVGGGPQLERWGTSWALEALQAAGVGWVAARSRGAGNLEVSAVSVAQGGNTPSHSRHETGMEIDLETSSSDGLMTPFYRTHALDGNRYIAAQAPGDAAGNDHVIVENPRGVFTAGRIVTDAGGVRHAPVNAVEHTRQTYDSVRAKPNRNPALLAAIRELIVDNAPRYDVDSVRLKIGQFAGVGNTTSGATVDTIYYNDPRTWPGGTGGINGVQYSKGHGGHFHVIVTPPKNAQ